MKCRILVCLLAGAMILSNSAFVFAAEEVNDNSDAISVEVAEDVIVEYDDCLEVENQDIDIIVEVQDGQNTEDIEDIILVNDEYTAEDTVKYEEELTLNEVSEVAYPTAEFGYRILYNQTVEITEYTGESGQVAIPDVIEGKIVTGIGSEAFKWCTNLKSISIPSTVTTIGYSAFYGCTNLTSIKIPSSVSSIGSSAFQECTSLKSVELPSGITSIQGSTFYKCISLTDIELPSSVTSIGSQAFMRCNSLTRINIPSGVKSIGSYAFYECTSLKSTNIPLNVKSVERYTFYDCRSLVNIDISPNVRSIEESAFSYCKSLTSIELPVGVTSIGSNAFCECSALKRIELPPGLTAIEYQMLYGCRSLTSIEIPSGVTSIKDGAFWECTGLTSMNIPSSVKSVGGYAFYGCKNLANIYFYGNAPTLGEHMWMYDKLNAYYPVNNLTWTEEMRLQYDGTVRWIPWDLTHYHIEVIDQAIPPTCTETGKTEGSHCSICKIVINEQKVVPALGHKAVIDRAVNATCTEAGLTEGSHCFVCNTILVRQAEVEKKSHRPALPVQESVTEATCTKMGRYDLVTYCSVCNSEITRTRITVSKGEHNPVLLKAVEATCITGGLKAGIECSICKNILMPQDVIPALGHNWSDWKTMRAATVLKKGVRTRTCLRCKKSETKDIAKLKATIKLSAAKKTIKVKKSYKLKISGLAKGDSVKSVTTSKKMVAAVTKSKTNQYKITAKKKGSSTITVTLISGKKATCKITVK